MVFCHLSVAHSNILFTLVSYNNSLIRIVSLGELGKQRVFGVIGSAVFAPITGIVLDEWAKSFNGGQLTLSISFYLN